MNKLTTFSKSRKLIKNRSRPNSSDAKGNTERKAVKRFVCTLCGKAFAQNAFLTIHLRSHTDERPFDCHICGKAFHQRSHLRYHNLTHSTVRKHKCPICGKKMRYKQSLKLHLRVHNEEKSYECDVCGKSFYEKPKLKIHRRVHTGEKPYVCTKCGRAFAQKGNCKKHNERYHARDTERKFPCHLCTKSFIWKKCLVMHLKLHQLELENVVRSSLCEGNVKRRRRTTRNKTGLTLLKENMTRFLPMLMEGEVLSEIGWPKISIEEAVFKVLIWCEQKPIVHLAGSNEEEIFEGNVKLLLDIVLAEKFTEINDVGNKSPNEIILALLKLSQM